MKGTSMKRVQLFVAALALVIITGCAALGMQPADTFNKKTLAAVTLVQTVADGAAAGLAAGKLSKSDAQNVVNTSKAALSAIDVAESLHATDPKAGEDKLAATLAILTALQSYLALQGAK